MFFLLWLQKNFTGALNEVTEDEFKIVRTTDLVLGTKYKIEKLYWQKTKYGDKVVAVLPIGCYYLPPRYARVAKQWMKDDEEVQCYLVHMTFSGRRDDDFASPILTFTLE